MAGGLALLAAYLVYPIVLLLIMSFNTAPDVLVPPAQWGLERWAEGLRAPGLLESIGHSIQIWFFVTLISLPIAVVISLVLARTNVPFSHGLESLFWVAFVIPPVASTLGWVMLLSPDWGFLNRALTFLPFVEQGPFNIYSVAGIVWTRVMGDGLAFYVILLTPPFRNMDGAFEEAGIVSGASKLKTLIQVTLPMMAAPIVLTLSLQLVHVFRGFETEWLLGSRFGYYVYSTLIYSLIRVDETPNYSEAIVLGSLTLLLIAIIIPIQRWVVGRRQYTTVQGSFRPALIDIGRWRRPAAALIGSVVVLLTVVPILVLVAGSFMTRVGFFNVRKVWTTAHWENVLGARSSRSPCGTA